MEDPATAKMLTFDMATVGRPDIALRDKDCLILGRLQVHVMLTPGHSRGSVCYRVDDALFSGDCLFNNFVGRTDYYGGSSEDQLRSVKMLYSELPDKVRVYPGHGKYTSIGTEKRENLSVRENTRVL
jgi:glyoxylase-like metal-dependent hydrolase (beta-lactamase superfamily II)